MSKTQTLALLLKKCSELGYSLIETVGDAEAAKLYSLALLQDTKSKPH